MANCKLVGTRSTAPTSPPPPLPADAYRCRYAPHPRPRRRFEVGRSGSALPVSRFPPAASRLEVDGVNRPTILAPGSADRYALTAHTRMAHAAAFQFERWGVCKLSRKSSSGVRTSANSSVRQ